MNRIIIATTKEWNIKNTEKLQKKLKGQWKIHLIKDKKNLTYEYIKEINPLYIFFPHWSWIIPEEVYKNFESIVFHITDLPYGRGGSPLQNLILNRVYNTKISALKVCEELDGGDIYLKEDFYIGIGSAEEIFTEISKVIFSKMIPYILKEKPAPYKQSGEIVKFRRRKAEESNIGKEGFQELDNIYDFIRMLDGEGYPPAFLKLGKFKIIFSEVKRKGDRLRGRFEIENE